MTKRFQIVGHIDHGKASLAAALTRVIAHGIDMCCGACRGRGEVGGFDHSENAYRTEACPACGGTGKAKRGDGERLIQEDGK